MTIVKTVDSEFPPSAASLALAKADGCVGWNGYLPGAGIAHGWTQNDFEAIRLSGLHTLAYASGRADPVAMKLNAAAWGIRGCLDVESSIRADGTWVQAWLDASGFGLYGNSPVHVNRTAAFHILAAYPGHDPGTNWPASPAPAHGWQWAGSVTLYGANVDRCWFDETIYGIGANAPSAEDHDVLLYQQKNGTVSLLTGGKLINLGAGPDITYLTGLGVKTMLEADITPAFAANILKAASDPSPSVSTGTIAFSGTGTVK